MKYSMEVETAGEKFGIDKAIIYAVINVESRFKKNAKSNRGAIGLMQIMPSTADEVSKKCNLGEYDLLDESDNITIGTCYLATLLSRFEDLKVALCAYNAGPAKVEKWLHSADFSDDGKTLKKIPFPETNNYIKKINKNLKYYSKKINTKLVFCSYLSYFCDF